MSDKNLRDEVAALTEAVHELRDREVADEIKALREEIERLRAEKPLTACCGQHTCVHWHYTPTAWYPNTILPYTVTCGQPTTVTMGASSYGLTTTNTMGAAGGGTVTYAINTGN